MRKRFYFILPCVFVLIAALQIPAFASELDLCNKMGVVIDKEVERFSFFQIDVAKPVMFNDIGCGIIWRSKQCTAIQMTFDNTAKVYDFESGEDLYMKDAYYVKGSGITTPVGYGIIAFKDREDAERFAAEKGTGTVLSYDDLLNTEIH